jgi:AGCS family alanine or glycine:cation symporter
MVIIGGIKRIGAVTGRLVPFMLALYVLAGLYVLTVNFESIPEIFRMIFTAAFSPLEASGAFLGGTVGYAFLFGMKRALFSNESGQGTSPIAHSAAKTSEPVREGVVAGLEPFVDTLVVCTITALVILSTGIWNRGPEAQLSPEMKPVQLADMSWSLKTVAAPERPSGSWELGDRVFVIVQAHDNVQSGNSLHHLDGVIAAGPDGGLQIEWASFDTHDIPQLKDSGLFASYVGATLTAKAFDSVIPGLGKWLVTIAVWLFALSTLISWSYYGEQGTIFLAGERAVLPYKIIFCSLTVIATLGFLETDAELDDLTGFGTGVMLFVNVPIMWLLGRQAMLAYKDYFRRHQSGQMGPGHRPPSLDDLISGRDVE